LYIGESEVPTYGYILEQSTEQESVMSLEEMMGGKDSVTFDHCSIFIDQDHITDDLFP